MLFWEMGLLVPTRQRLYASRIPRGKIIVLTDEEMPFYYRIRLNEFIAGEIKEEELLAKPTRWYEDQKIQLRLRTRAVDGNPKERVVVTENGERLPFDRLLVATGSRSFIPPIKGSDKQGVFGLRSIKDARAIALQAKRVKGAVVIGGGLLGLEAGNALVKLGLGLPWWSSSRGSSRGNWISRAQEGSRASWKGWVFPFA